MNNIPEGDISVNRDDNLPKDADPRKSCIDDTYYHVYVQEENIETTIFRKYFSEIEMNGKLIKLIQEVQQMNCKLRCIMYETPCRYEDLDGNLHYQCEPNPRIYGASSSVSIGYDELKGRKLISNKDINIGEVIIKEQATVLELKANCVCMANEHTIHRCYHCAKPIKKFYTCYDCDVCLFCSQRCLNIALQEYHRWECLAVQTHFWKDREEDYSYIAMRMMIYGARRNFKRCNNIDFNSGAKIYGNEWNNYDAIWEMETHMNKIPQSELNRILFNVTRALMYLKEQTDFFTLVWKMKMDYSGRELVDELGGIMLKHYLQALTNNVIISMKYATMDHFSPKLEYKTRGIFPTVALLNHSCAPNCNLITQENKAIVISARPIKKNEEITIHYSEIYPLLPLEDRQLICENLFFFTCQCTKCIDQKKYPRPTVMSLCCDKGRASMDIRDETIWVLCLECGKCKKSGRYTASLISMGAYCRKYVQNQKMCDLETSVKFKELVFHPTSLDLYMTFIYIVSECTQRKKNAPLVLMYGLKAIEILESHFPPAFMLLLQIEIELIQNFFQCLNDDHFWDAADRSLLDAFLSRIVRWSKLGKVYVGTSKIRILSKLELRTKALLRSFENHR